MRAAYERQKAAAKLRRLSAFDRARHPSNSVTDGKGGSGLPHGSQQLGGVAVGALDHADKEYFGGDRFQHSRSPTGDWVSRYRASGAGDVFEWRLENKMRTVACGLCMCLNIGVDPPGVDKPFPCAALECWIDPCALQPPSKSLELIGSTLQQQYTRLQPKAKFETLLDPTSGAVKRLVSGLRRHAKHERVLFHYNGHGVPRPTSNGEVWVFDKSYTLYVPLSIDDLLAWMGGPSILVLDCSGAGALTERFQDILKQKAEETAKLAQTDPERAALLPDYSESILLGACGPTQSLPLSNPSMPLDLFTCCLTTPLKIALKFFASNGGTGSGGSSLFGAPGGGPNTLFEQFLNRAEGEELIDKIPGKMSDRKTPLGELNWIYTAVTDTIAWNILPRHLFQKFFRQDLLLASLLRNYLLAVRIMDQFGCSAFSVPAMPHASLIAKHPMWASWDLCLEQYLLSLDKFLNFTRNQHQRTAAAAISQMAAASAAAGAGGAGVGVAPTAAAAAAATAAAAAAALQPPRFHREHINFFTDHLTAFEVWLEVGSEASGPPIQLPIVLQVLLSQVHRRRALVLLARFLGKGSWAVNLALAVGIFPYVLKLLQSPDVPLREVLIFIWTKLLALDRSVQVDVVREGHERYFVAHLAAPGPQPPNAAGGPAPAAAAGGGVTERQRVMSAFVLCALCDDYPLGQQAVLRTGALRVLASHLDSESPSLRKWMCLALGKLWHELEEAKAAAVALGIPERLCGVIADPVPEVRAAALYALGTFMSTTPHGSGALTPQQQLLPSSPDSGGGMCGGGGAGAVHRERHQIELMLAKNFSQLVVDASPLVREELGIALAALVDAQKDEFTALLAQERAQQESDSGAGSAGSGGGGGASTANSVPPSPSLHGYSSPGLYAFPSSSLASSVAATPGPLHLGAMHMASSSPFQPSPSPSPGLMAASPTGRPSAAAVAAASAAAFPSVSAATPGGSMMLARHLSESGPGPSSSPPAAGGLAISLSPNMLAASSAASPAARVTTPLSPLQLHGGGGVVSGTGSLAIGSAVMANPTGSTPRSGVASPPTPYAQHRGSLCRTTGAPSMVAHPSGGGGGGGTLSSLSPAEAAMHQQRQLIWRVVRTLSHDPFPGVARVAIALRKLVISRLFAAPPSGLASFASGLHSQAQGGYAFSSLQGSPLMAGSSTLSALNTVPEQSLADYESHDHQYQQQPLSARSAFDQGGRHGGGGGAGGGGDHSRGRSDGSITLPHFDQPVTRPRSRPVSEIDHPSQPPPPQQPHGHLANHTLQAPASILGAGGILSAVGPQSATQTRAPSPQPPPSRGSSTASQSPAASPAHHPTPAPGSAAAAAAAGRRSLVTGGGGQRLSSAFDDARYDSGGGGGGSGSASLLLPTPAPIPRSTIYARSAEYFVAPVGTVSSAGNHPSAHELNDNPDRVLETLLNNDWRRKRNSDLVHSACSIRKDCYDVSDRGSFDQIGALSTGFEQVSALLFHPFENLLVVAEKRQVALWDVKEFERVNLFSNDNARGTKISAVSWINEQNQSLLLAGSDDGVVRLWKNPHLKDTQPEIVSAWLAVRSMPRGSGVGLVLDWQQETGHLLAAGPVDSIRVWDVEREICVLDLPVDSERDSYVSSVCSMAEGGVVFAGCGDGGVRMFDLRASSHTIHTISKHPGSVVQVRVQKWGGAESEGDLLSGGINGDIHISDTRMLGGGGGGGGGYGYGCGSSPSVVKTLHAFDKPGIPLDTLAVHDHVPLFAAGSRKQIVHVADFKGDAHGAGGSAGAGTVPGATGAGSLAGTSVPPSHPNGLGALGSMSPMGGGGGSGGSGAPLQTGAIVSKFRYQKGFMGTRVGPVTSVAFHPSEKQQQPQHNSERRRALAELARSFLFLTCCLSGVALSFSSFSHKLLLAVGALNPLVSILAALPPSSL